VKASPAMSAQIKVIEAPRMSDLLHALRIKVFCACEVEGSTGYGPLNHE
jgi:hypothetical protein